MVSNYSKSNSFVELYLINFWIIVIKYFSGQPWKDSRKSNCVINMGDFTSVDDTFENILQVSNKNNRMFKTYSLNKFEDKFYMNLITFTRQLRIKRL